MFLDFIYSTDLFHQHSSYIFMHICKDVAVTVYIYIYTQASARGAEKTMLSYLQHVLIFTFHSHFLF